jgi:hypothetical protein
LPSSLTPEQRTQRARLAAYALWSKADPVAHTQPARRAFMERFERQVDPEGVLEPAERARRAEYARKQYFASLALKSSRVRSARKAAAQPATSGPAPEHGRDGP